MRIFLRPNPKKGNSEACTTAIMEELLRLGITPMLDQAMIQYIRPVEGCAVGEYASLMEDCDIVMPVGGDGTLMRCATGAVRAGKPIIGINTGRVGFLTQLEATELDQLHRLKDGTYTISTRMMLEGTVIGGKERRFTALNDVVVSRGEVDGIADVEVQQGERLITRQRGDGLIFATPTGSTAYSLSAGGPIVDPELELVLLTAICPHATFRCSMTLPAEREYVVREHVVNRQCGLLVTADGRRIARMDTQERLLIRKYGNRAQFIDLGLHDFYDSLNEKLSWRR